MQASSPFLMQPVTTQGRQCRTDVSLGLLRVHFFLVRPQVCYRNNLYEALLVSGAWEEQETHSTHRHGEPELKRGGHRSHTVHATQQTANPSLGGQILSLRNR